jgi:peptidoglycan/xylan/chitin deacetylase (PgdA/CDA1 family)
MKKLIFLIAIPLILSGCGSKSGSSSLNSPKPVEPKNNPSANIIPESEKKETTAIKQLEDKILILMYHYVRVVDKKNDTLGYNLSVEPDLFEKELAWLKENDYKSVPTKDTVDGNIPLKSVILSFDDGYADFYAEAWPRLKKFGFTASIGIIVQKINQPGYLTDGEIKELSASGIEILSHSLTHPDLTKIDSGQLQKELAESRKYLEDRFNVGISTFVYPSGKYNDGVLKETAASGYRIGLTTEPGLANLKGNLLELKRIRIDNRDGFEGFISKISDR